MESVVLKIALEKPRSQSYYLSPTLKQSRKVFKEIKSAIQDTSVCLKVNESVLEIVLCNGSVITFLSAEQKDSLRGYTASGCLVIDECAFISDDVINDVLPYIDANKSPLFLISTPFFKSGAFYEYFTDGQSKTNPYIVSFDWSKYDKSDILSPERLEFYRKKMPKNKFLNEYMGEFTELGMGIFGDVRGILNNEPEISSTDFVFGIDWGTGGGSDSTVITIFNTNKQMVDIVAFNDLDETQTIERIIGLVKQYSPIKIQVETNSIGQVFYGLLQKALQKLPYNRLSDKPRTQLIGFNMNNESKNKLVNKFQVAVQNKEVTILDNEELLKQMTNFVSKLTNNNKVTYAARNNYHDDYIISMMLSYDCLNKGNYAVY